MHRMNWDLMLHAPDEQGGASASTSADQPAALPSTVVVDGEEIDVQEAIKDHRNKRQWQASQTQRDQQLAAERAALTDLATRMVERSSAAPAAPVPPAVSESIDALMEEMPDPVEDKAAYAAWHKRSLQAIQQANRAEVEAATRATSSASATSQAETMSMQVVNDNLRMVDNEVREKFPDLSASQKQQLINKVDGLKASAEYAAPVRLPDGRVAHRFNESAVEAAAKLLGLSGKSATPASRTVATPQTPATITEPKPNAPLSDKVAFLRSLGPRQLDQAFTSMSPKDKAELGALLTQAPS